MVMVDIGIGSSAYANYENLSTFSYECIKKMMEENELVWKLLKYNDADAWNNDDLTTEEKAELIYSGQEDETQYKVFMDAGQPDAWTHEATVIRIWPMDIYPENRSYGTVIIAIEVYSHYKINHLNNYKTRINWIAQELIGLFNGADIGGVGLLFFNRMGMAQTKMDDAGTIPYKGKIITMGNRAA